MRNFQYCKVSSLEDALNLLAVHGEKACVLAGGTDLYPKMHQRIFQPEILVDLKGLKDLENFRFDPQEGLAIGALTPIRVLEVAPLLRERFASIAEAAACLGSWQIRNRATLGGNLCNASPAADMAPSLISLGAKAWIAGPSGERGVPLEEFFTGPGTTVLGRSEILVEVRVPPPNPLSGCSYLKHSIRKALDLAVVGVAAALTMDEKGKCLAAAIALGAAASTPMRARQAEARLRGRTLDEEAIAEAASLACAEARPVDDIRASAQYRREMVRVFTGRALRAAKEAGQ